MEFRNSYPAFNGDFTVMKSMNKQLILDWTHKKYTATAFIDVATPGNTKITYTDPVASRVVDFMV